MESNDLQELLCKSALEEVFSIDTGKLSEEELEDAIQLAISQLQIFERISESLSVNIHKIRQSIKPLTHHITLVSEERNSMQAKPNRISTVYSELLKQRDTIESSIVQIRSNNSKVQEEIENYQLAYEQKKAELEKKDRELKIFLEELKCFTENVQIRKEVKVLETPKRKDFPKAEIKPFPATSFSFNFGISKPAPGEERLVANKSLNAGEKSSRNSNVSNNTSMILDSSAFAFLNLALQFTLLWFKLRLQSLRCHSNHLLAGFASFLDSFGIPGCLAAQ